MPFAAPRAMRTSAWFVFGVLATGSLFGCATKPPAATTERAGEIAIAPRPNASRVALGRLLFHDRRLSRTRGVACSSCHALSKFGVDGKPAGAAAGEPEGTSAPHFNTQAHIAQIWDASVGDFQLQAVDVALADALGRVPRYAELFRSAFPNHEHPISTKSVGEAIEAFEGGLVGNSRWDRFAGGEVSALTLEEKHGLRVFLKSGCVACHTGPQVGGTMYQEVGIAYPWPNQKDKGRGAGTNARAERLIFRVPSLKNIGETAPYFHDNSTSNLEAAIRLMGHHQLGIELSNDDVNSIAAWMRALGGDVDPGYIAVPELPSGG